MAYCVMFTDRDRRRARRAKQRRAELHLLLQAQGFICPVCGGVVGRDLAPDDTEDELPTYEHAVSHAHGGSDALGNALVTHRGCNHAKGDQPPNGCELIWLIAVNERMGARWKPSEKTWPNCSNGRVYGFLRRFYGMRSNA